jgi:RNA recognition motif-containing protein
MGLEIGFVAARPCVGIERPYFVSHSTKERKMSVKLYVGNLAYSVGEDDLRTLFAQAGTVESVAVIKDRDSGMSKGFAFVEMSSQAEAQKAIGMFNNYTLAERPMKVNPARPKEERGSYGGGGGYGDRGGGGGHRGGPNRRSNNGPRRY